MSESLGVLFVGEDAEGYDWTVRALEGTKASLQVAHARPAELANALQARRWDAVVVHRRDAGSESTNLLASLRRAAPETPAVVVSGSGLEGLFSSMMKAGATDFVPWERPECLMPSIAEAVARRRSEARAATARAEGERRYRELLDLSHDGLFVADAGGRLTFANRALARLRGVADPAVLVGRSFLELVPEAQRAAATTFLHAAGEVGDPPERLVTELVRDGGGSVTIEVDAFPLLGRGPTSGTCGVVRERDGRWQAGEEARRLGEMLRAVADSLMVTDHNGIIELVNPAFERITGYRAEEVVGRTPRLLKSGEHDEAFYRRLWETIRSGEVFRATFVNRRKNGDRYHEEQTITPIRDASGRITHYFSIARDVTSRVVLEEKQRRTQRLEAVGRLAGGVAHDFNNLLTAISSFAHFAKESLGPVDPTRAEIEEIEAAASRAADLTGRLLAFARRQPVRARVVSLDAVLEDTSRMLERLLGEDVQLVVVPPPAGAPRWKVRTDPGAMEQLLVNLAVNAREAMPGGGTLTIELRNVEVTPAHPRHPAESLRPGQYVQLSIGDTGEGMSAEIQERLFEPFFTTKEQGSGLGLATCYGIVQQAGGQISVQSQPGQGTTFRIHLPRTPETEGPDAAPQERLGPAHGAETILLVEDDEAVRQLATRVLRRYGYQVLAAGGGDEALLLARNHPGTIALLLTDVMMPRMSGPALHDRLAVLRPGIRVLYMSGYPDHPIVAQAAGEDGSRLLPKPFSPEALARRVRQVLDAPE